MKIEVWEPPEKAEPEKVVRLRVLKRVGAPACVHAVTEDGQTLGCLFKVLPGGLVRMKYVDPALGFPLGSGGRVKLVGEE